MAIEGYKRCSKCGETKPLEDFHRHRKHRDGRAYVCKRCSLAAIDRKKAAEATKRWAESNPERRAAKGRRWKDANPDKVLAKNRRWVEKHPDSAKAANQKSKERHREKVQARNILRGALRRGEVAKAEKCEDCGDADGALHGHHHDYSKPLEVKWLCRKCHGRRHRSQ